MKNLLINALMIPVTLAATMSMAIPHANAEGYLANYEAYVISVEPWDSLNIRKWPAYYSQKIGEVPHDGQYIWVQRCIIQPNGSSSDWCKINFEGTWGWVNKSFLIAHN